MRPHESSETVSDAQLERYRLGELPDAEAARIRRALMEDADARARLAAIEKSDAEILEEHPPAQMAALIRAGLAISEATAPARPAQARPWLLRAAPLGALGALAVILAVAVGRPLLVDTRPDAGESDVVRLKGLTPRLVLFRKTAGGGEALADGATAHPGDVVQVAYQAAGRRFGVIVSVDGRGAVTLHLPKTAGKAAALAAGGPIVLDTAYELDDAPRWERFYLTVSDAPFDTTSVVEAVRRSVAVQGGDAAVPRLDLPEALIQSVFLLRKEPRP